MKNSGFEDLDRQVLVTVLDDSQRLPSTTLLYYVERIKILLQCVGDKSYQEARKNLTQLLHCPVDIDIKIDLGGAQPIISPRGPASLPLVASDTEKLVSALEGLAVEIRNEFPDADPNSPGRGMKP